VGSFGGFVMSIRGMWRLFYAPCFVCCCAILLSGCIDLEKLIPSSLDDIAVVTPDNTVAFYNVSTCTQTEMIAAQTPAPAETTKLPDEVSQNTFVSKLVSQTRHTSTRAAQTATSLLKAPALTPPSTTDPPTTITASDIQDFAKLVMTAVHRAANPTAASSTVGPPAANPDAQSFWLALKSYYAFYFQKSFTTYLGSTITAPALSGPTSSGVTISDTQISQAALVFVEFLFDQLLHDPVWATYDSTGKTVTAYYPGGGTSRPTYLLVNSGITPVKIADTNTGCGMNVLKAKAIDSLYNIFGTAASSEIALVVKSTGAIEIGLGVLGKLNVGDNTLVAELTKDIGAEIVERLTVHFAAKVLSAVDLKQQNVQIAQAMKDSAIKKKARL
jgi:hypothetical protein